MDITNWIQILDETVCISLHSNAIEKGINQSLLLPAINKLQSRLNPFRLGMATILEIENTEFEPLVLYLKIDFILNPVHDRTITFYWQITIVELVLLFPLCNGRMTTSTFLKLKSQITIYLIADINTLAIKIKP